MTVALNEAYLSQLDGRACAGSQRQVQTAVNEHPELLNFAIGSALSIPAKFRWVSPLREQKYREYRDGEFLKVLGLSRHREELRAFWPVGGPRWDALATVNETGILLVEAKSYVNEMYAGGSGACDSALHLIEASLLRTKHWLGVSPSANWTGLLDRPGGGRGSLYQSANRLAHLYFFRQILGMEAWLVNLCFVNDPNSPTSPEAWNVGLAEAKSLLGITHVPYAFNILVDAVS